MQLRTPQTASESVFLAFPETKPMQHHAHHQNHPASSPLSTRPVLPVDLFLPGGRFGRPSVPGSLPTQRTLSLETSSSASSKPTLLPRGQPTPKCTPSTRPGTCFGPWLGPSRRSPKRPSPWTARLPGTVRTAPCSGRPPSLPVSRPHQPGRRKLGRHRDSAGCVRPHLRPRARPPPGFPHPNNKGPADNFDHQHHLPWHGYAANRPSDLPAVARSQPPGNSPAGVQAQPCPPSNL